MQARNWQISLHLSTSLGDEAFYQKSVESNILPGRLCWATVPEKMELNLDFTGHCLVVGLPPGKAEGYEGCSHVPWSHFIQLLLWIQSNNLDNKFQP